MNVGHNQGVSSVSLEPLGASPRYLELIATAQAYAVLAAFDLISHRSVLQATGGALSVQRRADDVPIETAVRSIRRGPECHESCVHSIWDPHPEHGTERIRVFAITIVERH